MIGNDIVDLKQAAKDSNWQRPRFLDKVYTKKEQQLIFNTENQHQTVWLLWSMKEAAYKVNVQQFGKRFFNPKRIECELVSLGKGLVLIDDENYFTSSETTEDYVYSIATLDAKQCYKSEWFKVENLDYKMQNSIVRASFLKSISESKRLAIQTLEIKKTEVGVPQLFSNSVKLPTSFSLTHHGFFSAYSLSL